MLAELRELCYVVVHVIQSLSIPIGLSIGKEQYNNPALYFWFADN